MSLTVPSYEILNPLVTKIVENYHHSSETKQKKDFDLSSLKQINLDPEGKYIKSSRIRVARNFQNYPFPSSISSKDRQLVEEEIVAVLQNLKGTLAGKYFSLTQMKSTEITKLINEHMLFKLEDRFLESAAIHRDMPKNRGIFYSQDKQFIVWVNEEDHARIIAMQNNADIVGTFNKLATALTAIEKKLSFAFNPDFGYLTSCPTNIGTAMRASVHIKLPNLSKRDDFKSLCKSMNLDVRGDNGEHSSENSGVFDISNALPTNLSRIVSNKA